MQRLKILAVAILALLFAGASQARADAALFLEEPFGDFGGVTPTGHAAVYLSRICADSPTLLRRCQSGESGVVISRYHRVAGRDWIAIPLLPYLYAVDSLDAVPIYANKQMVAALRAEYRHAHLLELIPDGPNSKPVNAEWTQLVGSAYDRKIFSFAFETSEAEDDALIAKLNSQKNRAHFNIVYRNCADFSRSIINFYHPHAVHRSIIADAGITTPKQLAKSLVAYGKHHPEAQVSAALIPQVPGSLHRSEAVHGVLESILKSKKYVVPMAVFHPVILGTIAVGYFAEGRFNPARQLPPENAALFQPLSAFSTPASYQSSSAPVTSPTALSGRETSPGGGAGRL